MGIRWWGSFQPGPKDVGLFALPDARFWNPEKDETLQKVLETQAQLFVVGREDELPAQFAKRHRRLHRRRSLSSEGGYTIEDTRPLTGFRAFEHFVRGWITQGEMIGACTRGGKMPAVWMSVWLEGALVRNDAFTEHDNLREPWSTPFFHKKVPYRRWHRSRCRRVPQCGEQDPPPPVGADRPPRPVHGEWMSGEFAAQRFTSSRSATRTRKFSN